MKRSKTSGEKQTKCDGAVYRYSSDWIYQLESEQHWRLYWRQQSIMEGRLQAGDRILEIGVGSGFTANYLRSKGFLVTTVDIDEEKNPDIVANIVTFSPREPFDHILAFEVFEHIPFEKFKQVAENLSKKCVRYLFMSVPRNEWVAISLAFKFPKLGRHVYSLRLPKKALTERHHYWEIGYQGIDEKQVLRTLAASGFRLEHSEEAFCRSFYVFKNR